MSAYGDIYSDAAWVDLAARGLLRIAGEDRARLLHAICTNHVKNLAEDGGLYAFFLTAQGRILADAFIYNRRDAFFLDTEPETGEKLREHIDRYIIADDAVIEAVEGWSVLGLEGHEAIARATALGLPIPEKRHAVRNWQDGFVARTAACWKDGLRIFATSSTIKDLAARAPEIQFLTPGEARLVRLENGIPRYGEDIGERYLVQETGELHAVHFNKGCYLGQEIVERVRSRAQVHRHLHSLRIKASMPPASGTKLTIAGNTAGEITSAAYSPLLAEVVALAYVRTEALENPKGMIVADTDPPAEVYIVAAGRASAD